MNDDASWLLLKTVAFIAAFIFIGWFLSIAWVREQAKKDLRRQGFAPISVRWRPFAYWAWFKETGFVATFVDATGCIQTARCSVWFFQVRWIADDVKYLNKDLSLAGKLSHLIVSLFLVYFGLKHLLVGELVLSRSYRQINPRTIYLHGSPLILASLAALSYATSLLTAVVFCYRPRARERNYVVVSRGFSVLSWILFWLSIGVYSYQCSQNPNQFNFPLH